MNKDSMALLKFAIAIIIVAVLLIIWFCTVGAPAGDEEEIVTIIGDLSDAIPTKFSGLFL